MATAITTVTVPGNWTMQDTGDFPHYTNVQMPFRGPPPRLPERDTTGLYRTTFAVPRALWPPRRFSIPRFHGQTS